jgi:hypothetical protein
LILTQNDIFSGLLNGSSGRWTTGLTKSEGLYESQVLMKNEQVYAIALVELN